MSDKYAIYMDACPFIDMAKIHIGKVLTPGRATDVWFCKRMLEAGRDGKIDIYTSYMTRLECTHADGCKDDKVRSLFQGLLTSGKAGVLLVQNTQTIQEKAEQLQWDNGLNLRAMDAIHIASAIQMKCTEFITTDEDLLKQADKFKNHGLRIITASHTKALSTEYLQSEMTENT
jgi:predicted nucleic acid-binding protein